MKLARKKKNFNIYFSQIWEEDKQAMYYSFSLTKYQELCLKVTLTLTDKIIFLRMRNFYSVLLLLLGNNAFYLEWNYSLGNNLHPTTMEHKLLVPNQRVVETFQL